MVVEGKNYSASPGRMLEFENGADYSVLTEFGQNALAALSPEADREWKEKEANQRTVEQITMHQKGKAVVYMEQEEPDQREQKCANCGTTGVKTYQYQMCRPCLAARLRGMQDFIDEQRKEIFGER